MKVADADNRPHATVDRREAPSGDEPIETLNRMAAFGRDHLDALTHASHAAVQGSIQCQEIVLGFADQRMKRRYELFEQARAAASTADAIRLQAEFSRVFFEDYFGMIHELADLGQRLADDNLKRMSETATGAAAAMEKVA